MRQIFLLLPWELALTASKRNLTDKRYSDILQILTSTELRIGAFTDEEDSDRNSQTHEQCYEEHHLTLRRHRNHRAERRRDKTHVISRESHGELIFLTFLQEEEVELLCHLLLTSYALQIFSLTRHRRNTTVGIVLCSLRMSHLRVDTGNKVVQALHNSFAHSRQLLVVVFHERVLG